MTLAIHRPAEDILESLGDENVTPEEVEGASAQRLIRSASPRAICAIARWCSFSQYAKDTPYLAEARPIISEHLDLLGQPRLSQPDAINPAKRRYTER